ncbi:hypothetical protein FJSC11DRAFT_1432 [Fischerella thermalis JSC-11]|jgi:hypothetical protein|uniref:Uncharacterized protein n=1 Tax=Fischerella thermalis JSC-11 TaxID=741277 RepID=G6FRD5_9CYAN|nr:hypothetical protein FJSC11DRAFT_1432 [Fischerella thermalis JSC-11]
MIFYIQKILQYPDDINVNEMSVFVVSGEGFIYKDIFFTDVWIYLIFGRS